MTPRLSYDDEMAIEVATRERMAQRQRERWQGDVEARLAELTTGPLTGRVKVEGGHLEWVKTGARRGYSPGFRCFFNNGTSREMVARVTLRRSDRQWCVCIRRFGQGSLSTMSVWSDYEPRGERPEYAMVWAEQQIVRFAARP